MTETCLVYIYSVAPPARKFVGCGALVEGGYIATCRHVWRDAKSGEPPKIEIEFPRSWDNAVLSTGRAGLADACEGLGPQAPDLVLLKPLDLLPRNVTPSRLAAHEWFEVGKGYVHAFLPSRGLDACIAGALASQRNAKGQRNFKSDDPENYWFEKGSSGSPVFIANGQRLAGIIARSELGVNQGKSHLREAFVVPATTIIRYLGRQLAKPVAEELRIDLSRLQPAIDGLCAQDHVSSSEFAALLRENIVAYTESAKPVPASNVGADINATIMRSREKLGALDMAGALEVLQPKIAEIADNVEAQVHRLVPLLKERATVERLAFDYDGAKKTLTEVMRLAPDDVWAYIGLGDLYRITCPLEEAAKAYRSAAEAARRQGDEFGLSVSFNRLGDVQMAQGDLAGALKSYRADVAIAERLATSDPGNTLWQRDLSVSYNKIGDVQMAQEGGLAGALKSYQDSLAIRERLTKSNPGNAGWQRDLSISYEKIGDVQKAQGGLASALKSYNDSLAIRERLAKSDPGNAGWQRDLSVSYEKIGDVQMAHEGGLAGALKSYQDSLAIRERLAKSDPDNAHWRRDLSASFIKVGDVQRAQGGLAGALKSYNDSLATRERLANSDPGNAGWQYDLGISNERIGDVQMAQAKGILASALKSYEAKWDIISRLVKSNPGNAGWQRDLSVSYDRIGDVQMFQGEIAGALKSYNDSLAIRERLATSDPGNADWQRSLSVSFNKIGDVQMAQCDLAGALKSYEADLAIAERLAKSDPGNASWQRDLSESLRSLALVHKQSGDSAKALDYFRKGQAIMSRLTMLSSDNAVWKQDLVWFDGEIAELAER